MMPPKGDLRPDFIDDSKCPLCGCPRDWEADFEFLLAWSKPEERDREYWEDWDETFLREDYEEDLKKWEEIKAKYGGK